MSSLYQKRTHHGTSVNESLLEFDTASKKTSPLERMDVESTTTLIASFCYICYHELPLFSTSGIAGSLATVFWLGFFFPSSGFGDSCQKILCDSLWFLHGKVILLDSQIWVFSVEARNGWVNSGLVSSMQVVTFFRSESIFFSVMVCGVPLCWIQHALWVRTLSPIIFKCHGNFSIAKVKPGPKGPMVMRHSPSHSSLLQKELAVLCYLVCSSDLQ